MLKQYRNSELARRIKVKLEVEPLLRLLISRSGGAGILTAVLNTGHFVVRVILDGGRIVRGYGKSFIDAVRYLVYQVECGVSC